MSKFEYVRELIKQLAALGYEQFQINELIGEKLILDDPAKLEMLSSLEYDVVIEVLEENINFALKCLSQRWQIS